MSERTYSAGEYEALRATTWSWAMQARRWRRFAFYGWLIAAMTIAERFIP